MLSQPHLVTVHCVLWHVHLALQRATCASACVGTHILMVHHPTTGAAYTYPTDLMNYASLVMYLLPSLYQPTHPLLNYDAPGTAVAIIVRIVLRGIQSIDSPQWRHRELAAA
mmetsp:Transcript_31869/g.70811  ORF Transcript_31869/g.70811 Transcript_31869/m.70811 type:complete len:112 (-) Transcript_31869:219-554(-)